MYKLLALDLDGTVLNDEHRIHPHVKETIHELKQRFHVMIVTGRHHTAARPYHHELGLNTPILCCNGTYIYDYQQEKVLKHNAIEQQDALRFIELATEFGMRMVMYITDAMIYSRSHPIDYIEALDQWAKQFPIPHQPKIYAIDSFTDFAQKSQHIWKFVIEGLPDCIERLSQHEWVQNKFNGELSWTNRIDFAAKGNTKGQLLAEYIDSLGYRPEQIVAAGDNYNDISMLRLAGLGIAMANADSEVKAHAQLICPTDNNQGGLAQLLRDKFQG